jgi:hypothetical protein
MPAPLAPVLLRLPDVSIQLMLIGASVVLPFLLLLIIVASHRNVRASLSGTTTGAFEWLQEAITAWEREGRLRPPEAERLRTELREPDFTDVLPHLGVHTTMGVLLRFPVGTIVRVTYTVVNMAVAHIRFVTHRIDYAAFRRAMGIHSPLVLTLALVPGAGAFAYLAAKPFHTHHLLARVALDAAFQKLPKRVYERSGLRGAIARPAGTATAPAAQEGAGIRVDVWPGRAVLALAAIAGLLFVADMIMQSIDARFGPSFPVWPPLVRIFDLGSEASLGTWFAIALLILCSGLLAVIASAAYGAQDPFRRHWAGLSVLMLALSLDEQAKFHDGGARLTDDLRERLGMTGVFYYGWVLIALASLIVAGIVYWRFVLALPATTRNLLILAAVFYIGGEVGLEMVSGAVLSAERSAYLYQVVSSVEETTATLGVIIAAGALLNHIRREYGDIHLRLSDRPASRLPGSIRVLPGVAAVQRAHLRQTEPGPGSDAGQQPQHGDEPRQEVDRPVRFPAQELRRRPDPDIGERQQWSDAGVGPRVRDQMREEAERKRDRPWPNGDVG